MEKMVGSKGRDDFCLLLPNESSYWYKPVVSSLRGLVLCVVFGPTSFVFLDSQRVSVSGSLTHSSVGRSADAARRVGGRRGWRGRLGGG